MDYGSVLYSIIVQIKMTNYGNILIDSSIFRVGGNLFQIPLFLVVRETSKNLNSASFSRDRASAGPQRKVFKAKI